MTSESKNQWQNLILSALLGLLFTLGAMQFSFNYGRLELDPQFDDIGYVRDILWRMNIYAHEGFGRWWETTWQSLPESMYSYILGTVAFAISSSLAAPYYASGILLIGCLFGMLTIFGPAKLLPRLAILVFILAIPISALLVTEFRPDPAWGVALGFAVLSTLYWPTTLWTGWRMWQLAFLYGAALIIKPHISPVTFVHLGFALGLRGLYEVLPWRGWLAVRTVFLRLIKIAGLSLLVAFPNYVFILRRTGEYFYNIVFGQYSHIWAWRSSFKDFYLYFLTGGAASSFSGHFTWFLIGVPCIGTAVAFYRRERDKGWYGLMALAAIWFSLTVVVSGMETNLFFGAPFYVMSIGMTVYWLGQGYRLLEQRRPQLVYVAAVFLALYALGAERFPSVMHVGAPSRPEVIYNHRFDEEIYQAIVAHKREEGVTHVYFAAPGPIFSPVMAIKALQNGVELDANDSGVESKESNIEDRLIKADIVIAQDQGLYYASDYMPAEKLQDQILAWLRQRKDMQQVAEFGDPGGRAMFVFVHRQVN